MRWTAENDQVLFNLVLKTSSVTVDGNAVASLWPIQGSEERPTARAITERIFKIRKAAGAVGTAPPASSSGTPVATPRSATARTKKTTTKDTGAKANRKRKASTVMPTTESSDMEDEETYAPKTPSKKAKTTAQKSTTTNIKREPVDEGSTVDYTASFPYSPAATTPGNDYSHGLKTEADPADIYADLDNDDLDFSGAYGNVMSSSLG